jgi:uncharacterized protein (DUF2147 family)
MKQRSHVAAACGALLVLTSASHAFADVDPVGIWIDDTGRGAVEIKPCGQSLCGFVVAVKNAGDTKGCGKQIIGDAKPVGGGRWDQGWIYSPERRKNYDVELKPLTDGTLRVVGYAGTKLFSRTMIWTAAPADLKRCDAQQAAMPPAADVKPALDTQSSGPAPTPVTAAQKPIVDAQAQPAGDRTKADTNTPQAHAEPNNDGTAEAPGARGAGDTFKIGDLDIEQVLTRSPSGKCKLDLPWVKVQFDCRQD